MKKNYIKPNITVVEMDCAGTLLSASGQGSKGNTVWDDAFSGDSASEEDVANARRSTFTIWDEEE